ncbi:DNA-binding NarL/FixJ family response regulator [Arthrobacter sp. JUb119]|uniref:response regulator transcription factor n=1 Tax=Arthrobacter sp. JUb115 TaxID=2485108 RepID=UPI00106123F7|nr:response regulator transcription factor [Arthrobacter sp. JUb115]MCS3494507.1 DNA-binding NarL/FixJ family response regulator [Arthrobacter sp. JUb119]TDU22597.1 DNA-binding NarL/FixJ family response regulator [Arthrobacter sp. JUb115]
MNGTLNNVTSADKIRIHLVDEDGYSRSAITAQLGEASDLALEACFNTVEQSLTQKSFSAPDILLINILHPDLLSDHALSEAVSTLPETKVVLLTMNPSMDVLDDAYDSGIAGVISKRMVSAGLPNYIRAIAEGYWLFIRPETGGPCAAEPLREGLYKHYLRNLETADQEIVRYVALGLTNAQIAKEVHQSEGTVKKRLFDILAELGLSKRVHLALVACDAGIVRTKDLLATLAEDLRLGA